MKGCSRRGPEPRVAALLSTMESTPPGGRWRARYSEVWTLLVGIPLIVDVPPLGLEDISLVTSRTNV